ncbi:MAG: hypothetical protein Q4C58_01870 [Eubacteriales bacterium]|nr:hypothetical protein [Eubacteriales bacterium]
MEEKRDSKQEQLIRDLYDKLNWFTFDATDAEFDAEQVQAILGRLEALDPMAAGQKTESQIAEAVARFAELEKQKKNDESIDPESAFQRFRVKYHISDEDLARKNESAQG